MSQKQNNRITFSAYELKQLIIAVFGTLVFSIGVNVFIVPIGLYNGGFVGIGQLIRTVLVDYGHMNFGTVDVAGIIYFLTNVPLFVLAYCKMGKRFFWKTLICVGSMTAFLTIVPSPSADKIIIEDPLTACFIGGLIAGWGTGLSLKAGASGGGQDILGIYFTKKYKDFSVGKMTLLVNLLVYGICAFLFELPIVIYSIIYTMILSFVTDKTHLQNICMDVTIFTKDKQEEIRTYIIEELSRGCNMWEAKGGYTKEDTTIIQAVISKHELASLRRRVHEIDENAFVVCKDGVSVEGNFIKKM